MRRAASTAALRDALRILTICTLPARSADLRSLSLPGAGMFGGGGGFGGDGGFGGGASQFQGGGFVASQGGGGDGTPGKKVRVDEEHSSRSSPHVGAHATACGLHCSYFGALL